MACEHLNFIANAQVGRLLQEGNPEQITGFIVELIVNCKDCGLPFEFIGIPQGFSPAQAMVNFDATELRAPIKPSSDPVEHAKVILSNK